ncbi:MAG: AsmA-like C-terminal domain-containing protein [Alphaproteobacteria bacterium]|nr:AsmA-like C-terminal domain-containing protein [Alphaproteobacteria bacterium]MBO6628111.1 AsmA-like C-terminal domain-containing protein [Alphaproteobacteria bacterium]
MIRPAIKYGLEALGLLLVAMTLLAGLLVWRIGSGPVSLSFLNETILSYANEELETGSLALVDTQLLWVPEDRRLALSVLGAELLDGTGASMILIPEVRIDLRMRSLVQGIVALQNVELVGVEASVIRRAGTGIELALADDASPQNIETSIDLEEMLTQLADPEGEPDSLLGGLQSFGMRHAKLRFIDKVNDVEWRTDDATLVLSRDTQGVAALFDATLMLGEARLDLEMYGSAKANADRIVFDVIGSRFVPAALARAAPIFSDFSVLDAPLSGYGTLTIGRTGLWLGAELKLKAGEGQALFPPLGDKPIPVTGLEADLTLDPLNNELLLRELTFAAGENKGRVSGNVTYDQMEGFHVAGATVALTVDDLALNVDGFTDGLSEIDTISFAGRLDFDALTADISALSLRVGEGQLALSGRVEDQPDSPLVFAQGEASNISVERLADIWPKPLAKGAREWFFENVSTGKIDTAKVQLEFEGGMIAMADRDEKLPDNAMHLTFTVSDATVNYLEGLPPLQRLSGRGHLRGDRFDTWVDAAYVEIANDRLQLNAGHFAATALHVKGGPGEISMKVTGATKTVLALLDEEPLGFISRFGMDPAIVGGYGEVNAKLTLPLRKTVTMDDVGFSGRAVARDIMLPDIIEDVSLDGGMLVIDVERKGLSAAGDVTLNGVATHLKWQEVFESGNAPSSTFELTNNTDDEDRKALGLDLSSLVNGPVHSNVMVVGAGPDLLRGKVYVELTNAVLRQDTIGWQKPAGSRAEARFALGFEDEGRVRLKEINLVGEEVILNGMVLLSPQGDVLEANLPQVILGMETEASFTARRLDNNVLEMHAEGPRFDGRGVLSNVFGGGGAEQPGEDASAADEVIDKGETDTALTARFPSVLTHGGVRVQNVDVDLLVINGEAQRMVVTGMMGTENAFSARITPTAEGRRDLAVIASDAGSAFRAVDIYGDMREGKLAIVGTFDDLADGAPLNGQLEVMNYRIVDAPTLASLLTVGSLTGFADTLQGEGIRFVKLDMPFTMTSERFHVHDARMSGPAFGLTVKGQIDLKDGIMDLNGTVVPAYTINSILGNVPILGDIIVGREGEGIFAATYAMRGPTSAPTTTVNPLAALAPGFLRRLFEFGDTMEPEKEAPSTPPVSAPVSPASPVSPVSPEPEEPQVAPSSP